METTHRALDDLPPPVERRKTKVIIASASRSGTLGLYRATEILGYKPYHMYEIFSTGGIPHMRVAEEAIGACYNNESGPRRYNKDDYEKWFAGYDCIVEIPSWTGTDILEAYAQDPDVKFIMTERDPDQWLNSVSNSLCKIMSTQASLPFQIARCFSPNLHEFCRLNDTVWRVLAGGKLEPDPACHANLRKYYIDYIQRAKKVIPADRLLLIQLEDGLGWEQICPFLEQPIPSRPYPGKNTQIEFEKMLAGVLGPWLTEGLAKFAALATPILGVALWAGIRYGPGVSSTTFVKWATSSLVK